MMQQQLSAPVIRITEEGKGHYSTETEIIQQLSIRIYSFFFKN